MKSCHRSLVLSVDYEIFGNGSGDARQHIIEPTWRMAEACEKFGAPLTVYFEVEEYLAFQRERARLLPLLGYDPATEIRQQIVSLARRGHDIQLHLHPEWVGAHLSEIGRWQLRVHQRTVDCLFPTAEETSTYIAERKRVIDELLAEAGCKHQVTAYRAGAFCAQPGQKLLYALRQNGFVLDSSVVKGMHRRDEHVSYDFSTAPAARTHWQVSSDVAREDPAGSVTEVPIYSQMGRRYQQLTLKRLTAKFARHVPKEKQAEMMGQLRVRKTPAGIARFLLQRFPIKLDFHNMTAGQMLRWIRRAPEPVEGDEDVLVLIGHTKEHTDDRDFVRLLETVSRDPALRVISMHALGQRLAARRPSGRILATPSTSLQAVAS